MRDELRLSVESSETVISDSSRAIRSKRIFIVHGHDEEMKLAAKTTLISLGLEPIILHEQADRGRTVIEKFEIYSDVGFAVILLSPDDFAYPKEHPDKINPRARQNVIFEMGFFVGMLGREKTFLLRRGEIELPSDYHGIVYNDYDGSDGKWRNKLVKELRANKYTVSADDLH
jgi:predicted nucleotide-binding protein